MSAGWWLTFAAVWVIGFGTIAWWIAGAVHDRRVRKSDPYNVSGDVPEFTDDSAWLQSLRRAL